MCVTIANCTCYACSLLPRRLGAQEIRWWHNISWRPTSDFLSVECLALQQYLSFQSGLGGVALVLLKQDARCVSFLPFHLWANKYLQSAPLGEFVTLVYCFPTADACCASILHCGTVPVPWQLVFLQVEDNYMDVHAKMYWLEFIWFIGPFSCIHVFMYLCIHPSPDLAKQKHVLSFASVCIACSYQSPLASYQLHKQAPLHAMHSPTRLYSYHQPTTDLLNSGILCSCLTSHTMLRVKPLPTNHQPQPHTLPLHWWSSLNLNCCPHPSCEDDSLFTLSCTTGQVYH